MKSVILVVFAMVVGCGNETTAWFGDIGEFTNDIVFVTEDADNDIACVFPLYSQCKYASDCAHKSCEYATCETAVDDDGVCAHLCVYHSVECPDGQICWNNQCCQPFCGPGWECGDDGCGGSCGECPKENDYCFLSSCMCNPKCNGKECGDDGCGGICGTCAEPKECSNGVC